VRRSAVRVWAAFWLCGLLGALLGLPAAALAAGGGKKHTATATTAVPTPTATAPVSPSPAGGGSLGGGLTSPGGVATTTTATPTVISTATATTGSSGLSGNSAIAIAIGAFVVLGGISYFIWRDARRRAPVAARAAAERDRPNVPGSRAPPKARKLSAAERKRRKRGRAKR
jgi:hypothetical protein